MLPLEDIRVLDWTRAGPGPYCARILADMGAEVIRIDEPRISGESAKEKLRQGYNFWNRNKKSICLNFKTKDAREVFHKLARDSDVVLDGFRPGVAERIGIGYETIKTLNPSIIYCAITNYGQSGPYSNFPGHDPCCQAIGGLLGRTGTPNGHAYCAFISDLGSGMQATIAILCALLARNKSGRGQFVDISMTDCVVDWIALCYGPRYFTTGKEPKLGEIRSHVWETKDGKYVAFAATEPRVWGKLCRGLGLQEYIPYWQELGIFTPVGDFPYSGSKAREIASSIAKAFRTRTRDEWCKILADASVVPVYETLDEVFSDPQILHRKMIIEVEHPTLGKVKQPGIPIKLSDTPGSVRSLAPLPGEHTNSILSDLGYTKREIQKLRSDNAVV